MRYLRRSCDALEGELGRGGHIRTLRGGLLGHRLRRLDQSAQVGKRLLLEFFDPRVLDTSTFGGYDTQDGADKLLVVSDDILVHCELDLAGGREGRGDDALKEQSSVGTDVGSSHLLPNELRAKALLCVFLGDATFLELKDAQSRVCRCQQRQRKFLFVLDE